MSSKHQEYGKLYLIPVSLGRYLILIRYFLPLNNYIIEGIDDFIVENEKSARRFIKQILPEKSQPDSNFIA